VSLDKMKKIKYLLNCLGPDHIGIILSPYEGVHLEKWSILDGKPLQGPRWNNRETYFIYYACASDCVPFTFSIELNVSLQDKYMFSFVISRYTRIRLEMEIEIDNEIKFDQSSGKVY